MRDHMAFINLEYQTDMLNKTVAFPIRCSESFTEQKSLELGSAALAGMRRSYERSGWATTDYEDGFIGEKNGQRNIYSGLHVRRTV